MRKTIVTLLCLLLAACFLGVSAEELPSGERTVGIDLAPGWYSLVLEKSGFGATHVFFLRAASLNSRRKPCFSSLQEISLRPMFRLVLMA